MHVIIPHLDSQSTMYWSAMQKPEKEIVGIELYTGMYYPFIREHHQTEFSTCKHHSTVTLPRQSQDG